MYVNNLSIDERILTRHEVSSDMVHDKPGYHLEMKRSKPQASYTNTEEVRMREAKFLEETGKKIQGVVSQESRDSRIAKRVQNMTSEEKTEVLAMAQKKTARGQNLSKLDIAVIRNLIGPEIIDSFQRAAR